MLSPIFIEQYGDARMTMNFNRSSRFAVAAILAFFDIAAAAAPPSFPTDAVSNATSHARAIIQTELAPKVPGLAVAVAVGGAIVWSQGFGYADLAAKTPATPATRFRIGSVSKPLTAAGLALLVERGRIDMDAPVQKYIRDFPQKGGVITLRLLAGHLSGIRNYRGSEALSDKPYPNLRSALKVFENDPLVSAPGTKFSYSSYNWNVIGVAMEAAAKQDFLPYMQDNVFTPLGMTNTRPDLADVADPQRARFYETNTSGTFVVAPQVDCSYKWPSGGFLSTAEDLVRFGSAHLLPGFLKPESRKMLFTSQKTLDGTLTHYGVGWFVGRTLLYHKGDSIGGTSVLLLLPASRIVVAIVSNRGSLVFGDDAGRQLVSQHSDLNLVATAQKLANAFAPLFAKP
jgi:serine beta-lactamase-like protein LACTB, mitochondrial